MTSQVTSNGEGTTPDEGVVPVVIPVLAGEDWEYEIKPLWGPDLGDSFITTMECLSPVGMTRPQLVSVFNKRLKSGIRTFVAVVGTKVIGTASLHVLPKLSHQGRPAGLIEDVVVQKDVKHRGVGRALAQHCVKEARERGCYKITLDCEAEIVAFYALAGFAVSGVCMRLDLETMSDSAQGACHGFL